MSDVNNTGDDRETGAPQRIPISWPIEPTVPAGFVNAVLSQFTASEFYVTLAQVAPPFVGGPAGRKDVILDAISPQVMARIILTPTGMKNLIDILQSNYTKWLYQQHDGQTVNGDGEAEDGGTISSL